jgi:hypothetical protein
MLEDLAVLILSHYLLILQHSVTGLDNKHSFYVHQIISLSQCVLPSPMTHYVTERDKQQHIISFTRVHTVAFCY